jgi:hypothetical protein
LREKLQIKSEALSLLGKQLELCNKEKQEYKSLVDVLYEKNLQLKKNIYLLKEKNQLDRFDDEYSETFTIDLNKLNTSLSNKQKNHGKLRSDFDLHFAKEDINPNVFQCYYKKYI